MNDTHKQILRSVQKVRSGKSSVAKTISGHSMAHLKVLWPLPQWPYPWYCPAPSDTKRLTVGFRVSSSCLVLPFILFFFCICFAKCTKTRGRSVV